MDTLQIKKPDAIKAHQNANSKGKSLLENLFGKKVFIQNIRDRIQGEEDIFELNNTTKEAFESKWEGFEEHEINTAFIKLMVAAYNNNDGKLPDFTDGKTKYSAYFVMGSPAGVGFAYYDCGRWSSHSIVGARLVFYGDEGYKNMLDAVKKFESQYKKMLTT